MRAGYIFIPDQGEQLTLENIIEYLTGKNPNNKDQQTLCKKCGKPTEHGYPLCKECYFNNNDGGSP